MVYFTGPYSVGHIMCFWLEKNFIIGLYQKRLIIFISGGNMLDTWGPAKAEELPHFAGPYGVKEFVTLSVCQLQTLTSIIALSVVVGPFLIFATVKM